MRRPVVAALVSVALGVGSPAAAQNRFWLDNATGEEVVAASLAPADAPQRAVAVLTVPLPPGGARWIEPPIAACRLRLWALLQSGRSVALAPFDACGLRRVSLRAASPPVEDPVSRALIERLRSGLPDRGIRVSPDPRPMAAPPAVPGIEPLSPWGVTPPDTGSRR